MYHRYQDRAHAARVLAGSLEPYAHGRNVLVLGLPRGGVPVGDGIARALNAPLDIMVVRKLGAPNQPELAMGAIAMGGVRVLNPEIARHFAPHEVEEVARREQAELERRVRAYRGKRPWPSLTGQRLILVDDGLATGASMRAAVVAVRAQNPAEVTVAIPVAPPDTVAQLRREADSVICPMTPAPFYGVGMWYQDFSQVSDTQVIHILQRAWGMPLEARRAGEVQS